MAAATSSTLKFCRALLHYHSHNHNHKENTLYTDTVYTVSVTVAVGPTATVAVGPTATVTDTVYTVSQCPNHNHGPFLFPPTLSLTTLLSFPLIFPTPSSSSGLCHLAQVKKGDVDTLLERVGDKNSTEAVKHIVELARRASSRREVLHTDFLTPPILKDSMLLLEKLADVKTVAQGGYPQAERCRLSVGHPQALTTDPDIIAALSITGNFNFEACSHGDFLGSVLGTGIAREKLGDIMLQGEKGAHVLIVPELADFVTSALDKVGNVPVVCKKIPLLALEYEPPRTKTSKTVEASVRLDSIASAGYKMSRTKLADLISNGDVRVNWAVVTKSNTTIKSGDTISVSGKGRLKIGEINTTKKGKFAVELIRFL